MRIIFTLLLFTITLPLAAQEEPLRPSVLEDTIYIAEEAPAAPAPVIEAAVTAAPQPGQQQPQPQETPANPQHDWFRFGMGALFALGIYAVVHLLSKYQ